MHLKDADGMANSRDPDKIAPEIRSESGPEVVKLFWCSTQLSMKFQMLISIKISRNSAFVRLR